MKDERVYLRILV